jgi:hypothetical protein
MLPHHRVRRYPAPILEPFEPRVVPSAPPTSLTVPLDPANDQFGAQIETVQAYEDAAGTRVTFGIFDTGSSVVSFSADDQATFDFFGTPIPVLSYGGAQADGIGGSITGDVSFPGTIWVGGIHAATVTLDDFGFPSVTIDFGTDSVVTPGVQTFIGTPDGSPDLPTVAGTPVLGGTLSSGAGSSAGVAALMDMQGYTVDLSSLYPGLVVSEPDLHFVAPGTTLGENTAGDSLPVTVPVTLIGSDNHANPGNDITATPNPAVQGVTLVGAGATVGNQSFLFDTGSQVTVLSTAEALALGLDLSHPDSVLPVQGVGGVVDIPGFTLPELDVPTSDGGTIHFTNVPVYVLDVAPGVVDGLLGMNLFNSADQLLYNPLNPSGPSLSVTFFAGATTTAASAAPATAASGAPATAASAAPATALPLRAQSTEAGQPLAVFTVGVPSNVGSSLAVIGIPVNAAGAQAASVVTVASPVAQQTVAVAAEEPSGTIAPVPPPQPTSSQAPFGADLDPLRRLESAPGPALDNMPDETLLPDTAPPQSDDAHEALPAPGVMAGDASEACLADEATVALLTDPVLVPRSPVVEDPSATGVPEAAAVGIAVFGGGSLLVRTHRGARPSGRRPAAGRWLRVSRR